MPTAPTGMPVFEYAGASEPIRNLQITFEDLRKEKSKDFHELEKKEKVSAMHSAGFTAALRNRHQLDVQAAGRLMNHIKMGYFPTDPENLLLIRNSLVFPDITVNLLDPYLSDFGVKNIKSYII